MDFILLPTVGKHHPEAVDEDLEINPAGLGATQAAVRPGYRFQRNEVD
jgi:hypothetical protein